MPRTITWILSQPSSCFRHGAIFCGSGKYLGGRGQVSQTGASDFRSGRTFFRLQSVDTMQRRPIVNTRDEPHANKRNIAAFTSSLGSILLFAIT